jgi:DNA-directed RNA polymerase specialized sigma24 family protein
VTAVASEEVAAYRQLVEDLAHRYVDLSVMCEYDDLVQEGLIAVWESLSRDRPPSAEYVRYAMRIWRTRMERQRRGDPIAEQDMWLRFQDNEELAVHTQRS